MFLNCIPNNITSLISHFIILLLPFYFYLFGDITRLYTS